MAAAQPAKPITVQDAIEVDAMLEQVNGVQAQAAVALGLTRQRVHDVIKSDPRLMAKWMQKTDPVPGGQTGEIAHREPILPFSPDEQEAALALADEDRKLGKGWAKLGLKTEERAFLRNLQNAYAGASAQVIALTSAGVAHTYTRLLFVFEDLVKHIRDVDENPEKYQRMMRTESGHEYIAKGPHEYRNELYDRLISVAGEMRKVTTDVQKLQLVQAQIEKIKNDQGKEAARKKQGWSSTPVAVQVNVTGSKTDVVVSEPESEARDLETL